MSWLSRLLGPDPDVSKPQRISDVQAQGRVVRFIPQANMRGTYDAAQTTEANSRHWAAADALSADQANSYTVRKKIRENARYEIGSNGYAEGIVADYAADVVGQGGPALQMLTVNRAMNMDIEHQWHQWTRAIHLGSKLRTLQAARIGDGEGLAVKITNASLRHPVKLDIRLLECDRLHDPGWSFDPKNIDGVIVDDDGNPIAYMILDAHPGGNNLTVLNNYRTFPAKSIIHWFRKDRSEQHRGVSELRTSLPLFAYLRRYTLAVINTAEMAATITGTLETDAPPAGEAEDVDKFDAIVAERGMVITMPSGWKLNQMKAEQPTGEYGDFKREILTEIARPMTMPRNIASGDSSAYNFASGRLDHGTYFKAIGIVQGDMGEEVLDEQIFPDWLREARGIFRWDVPINAKHEWLWTQREPIDPREAKAETERLASGATTLPALYARGGKDWRVELEKGAEALGVSLAELQALLRQKLFGEKKEEPGGGDAEANLDLDIEEMVQDALSKRT